MAGSFIFVITPHLGEMARITQKSISYINENKKGFLSKSVCCLAQKKAFEHLHCFWSILEIKEIMGSVLSL